MLQYVGRAARRGLTTHGQAQTDQFFFPIGDAKGSQLSVVEGFDLSFEAFYSLRLWLTCRIVPCFFVKRSILISVSPYLNPLTL